MSAPQEDWPLEAWFRLAVLHLHISPHDFWDMSVRDWLWLCRRSQKTQFSQQDFDDLFSQFPDEEVTDVF